MDSTTVIRLEGGVSHDLEGYWPDTANFSIRFPTWFSCRTNPMFGQKNMELSSRISCVSLSVTLDRLIEDKL
jgi:hypothetical protein